MLVQSDQKALRAVMETHDPKALMQEVHALLAAEHNLRTEFYNMIHADVKAEFVGGEIVFHSPVRSRHWQVLTNMLTDLNIYVRERKLGRVGVEKVMISLGRNDFEPDIVFFDAQTSAGFLPDQKLFPAPQLVVEILSESTEVRDRGIKFREYALHGVAEYWIVDAEKNVLEQYLLGKEEYVLVKAHLGAGLVTCKVIEGFVLDLAAVFTE